jgi:2,3-bisphosphoglycerate-independent phosphoglycerate mutase
VSGDSVRQDGSARFTEAYGKKGSMGLLAGADVISTALKLVA